MEIGIGDLKEGEYDSTEDTKKHIANVAGKIMRMIDALTNRAKVHDKSKLESPEKEDFDKFTPRLAGMDYGGDEYKQCLKDMEPTIAHHHANNRHHPEFHENGIADMNLIDVFEMFADWCAATERHDTGNIFKSIELNQKRFGYSDELAAIMVNTAKSMKMGKGADEKPEVD
jgi:hypothetical protein